MLFLLSKFDFWYFYADEEQLKVKKKCKIQQYAYDACLSANNGQQEHCKQLGTMFAECLTDKTDPEVAQTFRNCVQESFGLDVKEWSTNACDKEVEAMQKSLKKVGLFPLPTRTKQNKKQ